MEAENENNESSLEDKFSPSFDHEGIPACLEWTPDDVAEWIEHLGFPQYKVRLLFTGCFTSRIDWSTFNNFLYLICFCFYQQTAMFLR